MRVRQVGGMTEFIPSPQEKRDALVRDYSFQLLELLHKRLENIEHLLQLDASDGIACDDLFVAIAREERSNITLNQQIDSVLEECD